MGKKSNWTNPSDISGRCRSGEGGKGGEGEGRGGGKGMKKKMHVNPSYFKTSPAGGEGRRRGKKSQNKDYF